MELFEDTQYHTFMLPDPESLPGLETQFERIRQVDLLQFWTTVRNHFTMPVKILEGNGTELPTEDFIPGKKPATPRKADLVRVFALLHCCPDNIRLLISLLPPIYGDVIKVILRQGCISYSELKRLKINGFLVKNSYYSWDRWPRGPLASLLILKESAKEDEENEDYHYERDGYLFLPKFLVPLYAEVLTPDMVDVDLLHWKAPGQGLTTISAENQFVSSFPLVQGIFRQSGIKLSGMKISAALAGSIQSRTAVPEIIPAELRKLTRISIGQYCLPPLVLSLERDFGLSVEEHVKNAVHYLKDAYAAYLYPALLPHIKGFRSNVLQGEVRQDWLAVLGGAFKSFPDEWISLDDLCDFIHGRSFEPWAVGYTIGPDLFTKMYPVNTITGQGILPNNQAYEIDREMLGAISIALYGMGAAELAIETSEEIPDTPAGTVRMVRLTPLGKYALDLEKEYHVEAVESQSFFSLDEKRLIIQSVSGNNPYESLLMDTAVPIGGGKFVMSAESFLKNCSSKKDVEEKVKFFEDYVANDPPQVWKDFFQTIRQRCKPLLPIKGSYSLLQLDAANKPLVDLILSDPEIRPLIIMAEDYRILVQKDQYDKLCKLLKKHGYLL